MSRKSKRWNNPGAKITEASSEKQVRIDREAERKRRVEAGRANDKQVKGVSQVDPVRTRRWNDRKDFAFRAMMEMRRFSGRSLPTADTMMDRILGDTLSRCQLDASALHQTHPRIPAIDDAPTSGFKKGELTLFNGIPGPMAVKPMANSGYVELEMSVHDAGAIISALSVGQREEQDHPGLIFYDTNTKGLEDALRPVRDTPSVVQKNGTDLELNTTEIWLRDSEGFPTRLLGTYIQERDAVRCQLRPDELPLVNQILSDKEKSADDETIELFPISCDVGDPIPPEGLTFTFTDPDEKEN